MRREYVEGVETIDILGKMYIMMGYQNTTSSSRSVHINRSPNSIHPQFGTVRTVEISGEPWFVGKDVATALGYANPSNAVSVHVDKEDKTSYLIQVSGSNYKANTALINESGLYSLILSSKLPSAKDFKHWVTSEV